MDYIDWIISSFVFLLMVSLVLLTISNIIPIDQKDDFFSKSIFISSVETIPVYNISINNPDNEIYPYSFYLNDTNGYNLNLFKIKANKKYGVIYNTDNYYEYDNKNNFYWNDKKASSSFEIALGETQKLDLNISNIPNLALWLDASSLELNDNELVSSWTDLSGNSRHATQSTDLNKPMFKTNILNGRPAIRFDGNGTLLSTPNLELTGDKYSIVTVLKNTKTTGTSGLFSFSYYYQGVYFGSLGNIWRGSGWGSSRVNINNFTNNAFLINSVIKAGGTTLQDPNFNLKIYNNTIDSSGTIGTDEHTLETSNNVFLRIGRWGEAAYSFGGDLSEFIVFNKVLTDNERLTVENYLSQKYAITVANGVVFNGNSVEVYNQNTNEIETTIEFLNKNTLTPVDCNYSYINKKIVVGDCQTDIIIKSKFNFKELNKTSYELNSPLGILAVTENFNDFDYSNSFTVSQDTNINAGILELKTPTTITTNSEFYDFFGFLSTTNALTVYISYTDVNNNYFCRFGDSTITIGKTIEGTQTVLQTTNYSKATDWYRVYFGYTKDNLIVCNAGETESEYLDSNNVSKTKIVISSIYNNTLIDDFYVYLNNDISSDSNTKTISGNYIDANFTNNLATINLTDDNFSRTLNFNFDKNLIVSDNNGISFVTTESEDENKLVFFPQTKEFWIFKDSDENIEINLDSNTGLDLDISGIENLALWLDASSLELNDDDLVGSWTDLSGNDYHATQNNDGNKPTFKTNILNENPTIRFDGADYLILPQTVSSSLEGRSASSVFLIANKTKHNQRNTFIDLTIATTSSKVFFDIQANNTLRSGGRALTTDSFQGVNTVETYTTNTYYLFGTEQNLLTNNIKIWENGSQRISQAVSFGATAYASNVGTIQTLGCAAGVTNYLQGDISEILLYNSDLSDSNRLLVENYLSQKYALDVENGLDFNGTSVELIDLNSGEKKIFLEFIDKETQTPVDCNYSYKNKKLTIKGCSSDVMIKTRFRSNGLIPTNPKPKITKTTEQVITKEKFDTLSNQSYYIRLFNNTLNLENRTNRPTTNFYKNFTKLLWSNGFLEEVTVEIKS